MSVVEAPHAIPCERCADLVSPEVAPNAPIPVPAWPCHVENVKNALAQRDVLKRAGYVVWQSGDEEAALAVYAEAGRAWDDAIHISDPTDPARSLCGNLGRNLCLLSGPRPDSGSGCWTCLTVADASSQDSESEESK